MMSISAVRTAIATAVAGVTSTPALTATAYMPDAITEPHAFIGDVEVRYDTTYGGTDELLLTLRVLVGAVDDLASQALLDTYINRSGTGSIKAAVEAWTAPSGADDIHVQRVVSYGMWEHAGVRYLGAEWKIRVI